MSPLESEQHRARAFGFWSLASWATLGSALEAAHAFKLSGYLDQSLRRELLVWGHAHGVGASLVLLAYAAVGVNERTLRYGPRLRAATVLLPLGFVLSVFGHAEADPGPAIWLVPLAALVLLSGLWGVARAINA